MSEIGVEKQVVKESEGMKQLIRRIKESLSACQMIKNVIKTRRQGLK